MRRKLEKGTISTQPAYRGDNSIKADEVEYAVINLNLLSILTAESSEYQTQTQ